MTLARSCPHENNLFNLQHNIFALSFDTAKNADTKNNKLLCRHGYRQQMAIPLNTVTAVSFPYIPYIDFLRPRILCLFVRHNFIGATVTGNACTFRNSVIGFSEMVYCCVFLTFFNIPFHACSAYKFFYLLQFLI